MPVMIAFLVAALSATPAFAQDKPADTDMHIQIETKIRAAIRYELAAGIPLVP